MTKPAQTYEFATGTVDHPSPTSDPGVDKRASGFLPGKRLPAKWLNYMLNGLGAWTAYVANLHGEPDFLNEEYTWTGWHRFRGGFTSQVGLGLVGTGNEILYTDDAGGVVPRSRTIQVPLTDFVSTCDSENLPGWIYTTGFGPPGGPWTHGWSARASEFDLVGAIRLPQGAAIQRVQAVVKAAPAAPGGVIIMKVETSTNGVHGDFLARTRGDDGLLDADGLAWGAFDAANQLILIRFSTYLAYGSVQSVKVTFLDPGPRNF